MKRRGFVKLAPSRAIESLRLLGEYEDAERGGPANYSPIELPGFDRRFGEAS